VLTGPGAGLVGPMVFLGWLAVPLKGAANLGCFPLEFPTTVPLLGGRHPLAG